MEASKTHWREFHPTDYIGAYAFEPGEEKVLTIKSASRELVKDEKGRSEECLVVHWKQRDTKPMIINVTNAKAISKVAGSNYIEDWAGVTVSLFTTEVNAFGEIVEAVRIRQTAPKINKPKLTPDSPKWAGARAAMERGETSVDSIRQHYQLSEKHASELESAAKAAGVVL